MTNLIQTMTSQELSEISGKRHDNVKTDIERILGNVGINFLGFQEVYKNDKNQNVTIYRLPKKETLLVTSKWSDVQRWQIIEKLEEQAKELTPAEFLLYNAQRLVDQEREQARLASRQSELEASQNEIKSQVKALVEGEDYFTVVGLCNQLGVKVDSKKAAKIGKKASKICQKNEWETGSANHPLYGSVNTYPREAIVDALDEEIKH